MIFNLNLIDFFWRGFFLEIGKKKKEKKKKFKKNLKKIIKI